MENGEPESKRMRTEKLEPTSVDDNANGPLPLFNYADEEEEEEERRDGDGLVQAQAEESGDGKVVEDGGGYESDEESEGDKVQGTRRRGVTEVRRDCPYLDTVNRQAS